MHGFSFRHVGDRARTLAYAWNAEPGGHMRYVVVEWQDRGTLVHDPSAYLAALPSLQDALPPGARAHACDPQHYDFSAARCVKDLRLTAVPPTDGVPASLTVRFEPNPWKHAEGLTIRYRGVASVRVDTDGGEHFDVADANSLRLDEVLPHQVGCSHELRFVEGTVRILCEDFEACWE
ncbi:hypothetical protein [Streptacidiphilus rugosus]|uniref:hypothetical protein n=1 Tax=Streptacidiphilus rugosus TaxID=405783 RepID=UPI000AC3F7CC|nr:hypothetical protein [Streptacidiphilus rugosus]